MIEWLDTSPPVDVQDAEYKRLLGYPRERELDERAVELMALARAWYAANGRPWVYARQVEHLDITNGSIHLGDETFTSKRLQKILRNADAHGAVVVAVSAGPELEHEAQRLWREEKPDEYFFLEIYGSAVVEHLITTTGARLCAWADGERLAVLPHYSPGYADWDVSEQPKLWGLIGRTWQHDVAGRLEILESGMPRPKKSLLAVFGLTRYVERVRKLTELVPCQNCSLTACQYRRADYMRAARQQVDLDAPVAVNEMAAEELVQAPPLNPDAKYATSLKALRRWAEERLNLRDQADGTVEAKFRYEGNTCSNMGRAFKFDYAVKLSSRDDGYVILEQQCAPAAGDDGHQFMCKFRAMGPALLTAIADEKPLVGKRLDDVLSWQRPSIGPSCYCEADARKHKWGLVLETIHYALVQREKRQSPVAVTIDLPRGARQPQQA